MARYRTASPWGPNQQFGVRRPDRAVDLMGFNFEEFDELLAAGLEGEVAADPLAAAVDEMFSGRGPSGPTGGEYNPWDLEAGLSRSSETALEVHQRFGVRNLSDAELEAQIDHYRLALERIPASSRHPRTEIIAHVDALLEEALSRPTDWVAEFGVDMVAVNTEFTDWLDREPTPVDPWSGGLSTYLQSVEGLDPAADPAVAAEGRVERLLDEELDSEPRIQQAAQLYWEGSMAEARALAEEIAEDLQIPGVTAEGIMIDVLIQAGFMRQGLGQRAAESEALEMGEDLSPMQGLSPADRILMEGHEGFPARSPEIPDLTGIPAARPQLPEVTGFPATVEPGPQNVGFPIPPMQGPQIYNMAGLEEFLFWSRENPRPRGMAEPRDVSKLSPRGRGWVESMGFDVDDLHEPMADDLEDMAEAEIAEGDSEEEFDRRQTERTGQIAEEIVRDRLQQVEDAEAAAAAWEEAERDAGVGDPGWDGFPVEARGLTADLVFQQHAMSGRLDPNQGELPGTGGPREQMDEARAKAKPRTPEEQAAWEQQLKDRIRSLGGPVQEPPPIPPPVSQMAGREPWPGQQKVPLDVVGEPGLVPSPREPYPGQVKVPLDVMNPEFRSMDSAMLQDLFAQRAAGPEQGYAGWAGDAASAAWNAVEGLSTEEKLAIALAALAAVAGASGMGSPLAPLLLGGSAALAGQP